MQVNGSLQCIGSSTHLKNRFGKGVELDIKLAPPDSARVAALATKVAPGPQGGPETLMTQEDVAAACSTLGDASRLGMLRDADEGPPLHGPGLRPLALPLRRRVVTL